MGLLLTKCWRFCYCCCGHCCRQRSTHSNNSVGVLPERHYKVLLLGLAGSGKTEVGHVLSKQPRGEYESTNGVQYYRTQLPDSEGQQLAVTEVGGNAEMQKIWHHYFATTMGILYCFDLSTNYAQLQAAFELLHRTLTHPFMRGKPVLLIATKADLMDDGVQLYDIENVFQLESLARRHACAIHLSCFDGYGANASEQNSLYAGAKWLIRYLRENIAALQLRIVCDQNEKNWHTQIQKLIVEGKLKHRKYQRFPQKLRNKFRQISQRRHGSRRVRPYTAPPSVYFLPSPVEQITEAEITPQAASKENADNSKPVPNVNSYSSQVTEV